MIVIKDLEMCRPQTRGPVTELSPGACLRHNLEMWPTAQVSVATELSPHGCLQPVSSNVTHRNSFILSSTTPDLTSSLYPRATSLQKPSRDTNRNFPPPEETYAVTGSLLCSSKTKSKLSHSNLTIVSLQWSLCLFVSISCTQNPSLA